MKAPGRKPSAPGKNPSASAKKPSASAKKPSAPEWAAIFAALRASLGDALPSVSEIAREKPSPFAVLVSTIISLRTKDEVTLAASRRLLARVADPAGLAGLGEEEVARLIYPAGFYKTKAARLVQIARIVLERGGVPDTIEGLLELPGVGRKTANLVLLEGFGKAAICVDVHVHRISNRMGWVTTRAPEATEAALAAILPAAHWKEINALLVAFGQRTCRPVSPFCSRCALAASCARIGVGRTR